MGFETPFISPEVCNLNQLGFLTVVYAVVLYQASNLIASGSELLLLVPPVAGLVGSIVLPILGAVPDGMMVLFSGLGPDAQNEVSVGVGALAGSTVMLLTFPWFIAIMFGRVPIGQGGKAMYGSEDGSEAKVSCLSTGISISPEIRSGAKVMLMTTALFAVIQVPATLAEQMGLDTKEQANMENRWAFIGLIGCAVAFVGYLIYCYLDANEDKQLAAVIAGVKSRQISIGAALRFAKNTSGSTTPSGGHAEPLVPKDQKRLKAILKPFFAYYDDDRSGTLSIGELKHLLADLGLSSDGDAAVSMMRDADTNGDGEVSFEEFCRHLTTNFLLNDDALNKTPSSDKKYLPAYDDDDEEEEMPEDLADLSPAQQLRRVVMRSFWMMSLGTAMVLVFSDPMVDVLGEWGKRLDISPFYISFVLAPFASNASELLAAYSYAVKKSEKSITTSLSTLIGAACMNNTFCLGIFLGLVYCKKLAWQFTAETVAMVVIQWIIGFVTIVNTTHTVTKAFMILSCYPGCLLLVWFFENILMWD